ncbi:hypothetical protein [Nocardia sp. NPDC004750]
MRFLSTRERDGGVIGMTSSLDRWLVGRSARVRATPADRALKALSTAADKSRLWMGLGAILFVAGDRPARPGAARCAGCSR